MRVLIVDDDPIQRKLLELILSSAGHGTAQAEDGVEALEILLGGGFDTVITDVLMPRMDGYRLCHEIRKSDRLHEMSILVYTSSFTSLSDERLAMSAGADAFVPKPANAQKILDTLERIKQAPRPKRVPTDAVGELEILKIYSASLVRRLEEKNVDLEAAHERLTQANVGLARDVTNRRRAEEELRTSEERYRQLFDHNLAGVVRSTLAGRLLDCNDATVRIYGYDSREELLLRPASDFYPDGEERAGMLERLVPEKTLLNYEQRGRRKDGSEIWLLCNYVLKDGPDGDSVLQGTILDITEKRRLEDQLRQSQKMEAVGQLAGGIAHDFNNILTTILGYGSLALERIDPEDPLFEEISEIQHAGERAAELTRKLLAFSRKQILEPRVLDLNAAVSGMERMLRRVIGEDVELIVRPADDLGCVRADPGQIEQVLLNLAVNSRDAMPRGGLLTIETVNVTLDSEYSGIQAGLPSSGDFVMLAVSDTGCGIDPKTRAHIFEPFFTTKEQGKGTGLGLSTVYGIVQQSGGYIACYSEPGIGTAFKIYLPRVREQADASLATRTTEKPRGSETVLLVEDEEALAKLARRALEKQGYRVFEARSGAAALEIGRSDCRIDLLLTDVVMPGMSGPDLARDLQFTHPDLKVLFMSGYTDDAIIHHGILSPGIAFLQKPFTPASLAHKVREVLGPEQTIASADRAISP